MFSLTKMRKNFKWGLMVTVLLLFTVNYFAAVETISNVCDSIDKYIATFGYYFSVTKPLTFIFERLIPLVALIGFIFKLNNKEFLRKIKQLYGVITIGQLLVLVILLPLLLLGHNKTLGEYYSKKTS